MASGIVHFFETDRGKRLKNMIIGLGASVVILGALFKILHWPFATEMLMAGMLTEAFLFALLGMLPPHADYYWEKIYPNLNIAPDVDKTFIKKAHGAHPSVSSQIDNLMEKAEIGDEHIQKFGDGFKKIADNAAKLSDISDAVAATNDYTTNARSAAVVLGGLNESFKDAAENMKTLGAIGRESQAFHEQVQTVTKNLASLNAMYELELQDTSNHLKAMNNYYGNLVQAMDNMNSSVADTVTYKEQMASLSKNLSTLNNVYGNMLSAMSGGAR